MQGSHAAPQPAELFRPEQTYFTDPVLDRVMGVTMALAAEVFVLRSRLRGLEAALVQAGISVPPAGEATDTTDADAFVAHLFQPTLGAQQSRGPL